jgi:UDP-N-acetylglucosamine 2-epimerase (non-hydrolysing)
MIDTLVAMEPRFRDLDAAGGLGLTPGDYLLVTLHRPALVDGPLLHEVIDQLGVIARDMPVVFPAHPRTRKMLGDRPLPPGLRLSEPVGYLEFLSLQADAAAVLTDSGGVQEETTFLGVPCFTLRDNTERPVTVRAGTNTMLGLEPSAIGRIPSELSRNHRGAHTPPPGWDGRAAERVADVLSGDGPGLPLVDPQADTVPTMSTDGV